MKQCARCGKNYILGGTRKKLRGVFNPTNWTRKRANLQQSRLLDGKRQLLCVTCIRTLSKDIKESQVEIQTETPKTEEATA
jgi:DNA-directed RNA polymerase subunit RPC12/RpoP